jgi:hypothetical protein
VRREVVRSHVGLDLDQTAPQLAPVHLADQHLAKQVARDGHGFAIEESGVEDLAFGR